MTNNISGINATDEIYKSNKSNAPTYISKEELDILNSAVSRLKDQEQKKKKRQQKWDTVIDQLNKETE